MSSNSDCPPGEAQNPVTLESNGVGENVGGRVAGVTSLRGSLDTIHQTKGTQQSQGRRGGQFQGQLADTHICVCVCVESRVCSPAQWRKGGAGRKGTDSAVPCSSSIAISEMAQTVVSPSTA
eukprot:Sspe_Gene.117684::Locus_109287_Transcript_1_1_Confidence_1.000_Length_518::g.117684::m.117684